MDRDIRIYFLFIGVPAILLTAAGLLMFGAIRGNFDPLAQLTDSDIAAAAKLRKKVRYVVE